MKTTLTIVGTGKKHHPVEYEPILNEQGDETGEHTVTFADSSVIEAVTAKGERLEFLDASPEVWDAANKALTDDKPLKATVDGGTLTI